MEKISAFMDGEAAPTEAQQAINRLKQDSACRDAWNCFHMVGDVMRGDPVLRDDFLARLRQRMDAEPTVLAPRRHWRNAAFTSLAIAASLAFVTVVTKIVMPDSPLRPAIDMADAAKKAAPDGVQVAQAPAASTAQVNEYLMAHQEFSPRTALQGVVPYVRSVSATHDGNRR